MRAAFLLLALSTAYAPHITTWGSLVTFPKAYVEQQHRQACKNESDHVSMNATFRSAATRPLTDVPFWSKASGFWAGNFSYSAVPSAGDPCNYTDYHGLILRDPRRSAYFQRNVFFYRALSGATCSSCAAGGIEVRKGPFGLTIVVCSTDASAKAVLKIFPDTASQAVDNYGSTAPFPVRECEADANDDVTTVLSPGQAACGASVPGYSYQQVITLLDDTTMRRMWSDTQGQYSHYLEKKVAPLPKLDEQTVDEAFACLAKEVNVDDVLDIDLLYDALTSGDPTRPASTTLLNYLRDGSVGLTGSECSGLGLSVGESKCLMPKGYNPTRPPFTEAASGCMEALFAGKGA